MSRARWITVAGIFLTACFQHALNLTLSYGESQTLVYAKQAVFPGYIPNDWYLSQPQLVRMPYQVLVAPLIATMPLHTVSLVARVFGYFAVACALGSICARLKIRPTQAWIGFGAFLWVGQSSFPGREWIIGHTESKVLAYALVLFAVHELMQRQLWRAALLAGLATTMHILVGFWASVALGLVVLFERVGDWRQRAVASLAWAGGAALALYAVAIRLLEPTPEAGVDATWLWVNFRNPHYALLRKWPWDQPWVVALCVAFVAALVLVRRVDRTIFQARIASGFALATLIPLIAAVMLSATSIGPTIMFYFPFRVADTIVPLFGCILATWLVFRFVVQENARRWVVAAGLLAVVIEAGAGLAEGLEQRRHVPTGGLNGSYSEVRALREVCDFFQERTEPGTVLLAAPDQNLVNYYCERPVVVTFRNVPSSAVAIGEWYERLVDLNGGKPPKKRGYDAAVEIAQNFNRLDDDEYVQLGEKYGTRYVLLSARADSDLPAIFDNRYYALRILRPPGDS